MLSPDHEFKAAMMTAGSVFDNLDPLCENYAVAERASTPMLLNFYFLHFVFVWGKRNREEGVTCGVVAHPP